MDLNDPVELTKILTAEEISATPIHVQDKFKNYLSGFFDQYCKEKAATHCMVEYEQKTEELQSRIEDYDIKLQNCNQLVNELREQLDNVTLERNNLRESASSTDRDVARLRMEKNTIDDERNSLLKMIERKNAELGRMQQEIRNVQLQLKAAISTKCDAIARVDEIESKAVSLDFKERRMEQERVMLHNQIQTLSEDLSRNMNELQNIRRDNAMQNMHLQTRLGEKTEELKIAQTQCCQYQETIDRLNEKLQELTDKMRSHGEDATKMMDYYKKELEAKTNLAELYKNKCDDTTMEHNELTGAIADMKRMLAEASDQYGQLETELKATKMKHEQEIEEKDKIISSMKTELEHANELLKEMQHETVENAISKIAPSAAIASKLIRSDMSLTELYTLYVKSSEELELQKRENSRLSLQLKTILQELSENAPTLKKRDLEYEKLKESKDILVQQCEELVTKKADLDDLLIETHKKVGRLERELKAEKFLSTNCSRQVCQLLLDIEQMRRGLEPTNHQATPQQNMATSDEVIARKLVTFNTVHELKSNNEKLLLLVHDLTTRIEEADALKQQVDQSSYQSKIESYKKKFDSMQETLNQQNNTVATLLAKCERYRRLYFNSQKFKSPNSQMELSDAEDVPMETQDESINKSNRSPDGEAERRIRDLEQQLENAKSQYKSLKEQHEYYTQEKKNNEKLATEQFESLRKELRELTSANCKMMSSMEYSNEQVKLQQKNIATYKQQIAALEERKKNYETTIIKHENTVVMLKEEIVKAQRSQSAAESETNHLRHENRILKDTANRLQAEKEGFHREHQNQSLLLNNLEMIKSNLERSEVEGRARLEERLDETVRELAAQRRRFQEEEDRFREMVNELKRQTDTATKRMAEEKQQAEKCRGELTKVREELVLKSEKVDELTKKLQATLSPTENDNPIALAHKRTRELELQLEGARNDIASLTSELAEAREHNKNYYQMAQSAESEIKNLHEMHTAFVAKAEEDIKQLKEAEFNLKSQIEELEAEVQLSSVKDSTSATQSDQLVRSKEELKDALQKLSECNRNLRALRAENTALSNSLNTVEAKYTNEMAAHSADLQALRSYKERLTKVVDETEKFKAERDSAKAAYEEIKNSRESSMSLLHAEKEQLEKRIIDLNVLNSSLHDQIEALTTKLAILSQMQVNTPNTSTVTNESIMESSIAELNHTHVEDDIRNTEQLLQIIKLLRKEKDLSVAKADILKAETTRLMSELTIAQKKIDELNGYLNQERTKSEADVMTATKHDEFMRKMETINALTDSNRVLREERNDFASRCKDQKERISALEDQVFPLQNQTRELSLKLEELNSENMSLRTEAIKWRQRANVLVEKSNKNPEEFKRLQMERENLAKMLTVEKDNQQKVIEELNTVKTEKSRVEYELASLEKQFHQLNEEKKKIADEYNAIKQNNQRMINELMELKNRVLQNEEVIKKLDMEVNDKEKQLIDIRAKEVQIRKIAKRYKDSYMELANKPLNAAGAGTAAQDGIELATSGAANDSGVNANEAAAELEKMRLTVQNLNEVVKTMQEENDRLRKEIEELKGTSELFERTKVLLRDSKLTVNNLTESLNSTSQELAVTQSKLQVLESAEANVNDVRVQLEQKIARLEKELLDQTNANKENCVRFTRENESLMMRINHLSRQLGLQQSAKPSTSSVANTDKGSISESSSPRTANVKPMSGSTVQQSATVTPWRGSETPLASIRPISVQNSRTAAVLPTSQQTSSGSSNTTSSSSSTTTCSTNSPSSGSSNTALVPPQQQVHTTGSASVESMSSSPTSSHTDYMPSTSSAAVAVAAIPPMGSASSTESSQEAESIQQPQQNESQLLVSGGQQQVVALVSPRVEGSSTQNTPSPNIQLQQDPNNQQPSTSGTSSSTSHIAVSSHNRHTPSSSNVTTSQAGCSSVSHKRPREPEGDSSTGAEECGSEASKQPKRMRAPMHGGEAGMLVGIGITDSGIDVEYQVPTSSQRDQEDEIVVVDSDEENRLAEADDGPADGDAEHEAYEDSYEQDQDMDENECPEVNESHMRVDPEADPDNNEVDVDEGNENQAQCSSGIDNQAELSVYASGASTSQAAAAALAHSQQQDNHQQSQTITSGSYESNGNALQPGANSWKPASTTFARQPKTTLIMAQQGVASNLTEGSDENPSGSRQSDSCTEIGSTPQRTQFGYSENITDGDEIEHKSVEIVTADENVEDGEDFIADNYDASKADQVAAEEGQKNAASGSGGIKASNAEDSEDGDEEFAEEVVASVEVAENVDSESHHSSGATQSEMQEIQQNQIEGTEENEGVDGVSSEGEKPAVEEMEEEGREAEATTPSPNTRSRATKGAASTRRASRGFARGSRPTPIVWHETPGNSRNTGSGGGGNQRLPEPMSQQPQRGFPGQRAQRGRRMRRPSGAGFPNMRYS